SFQHMPTISIRRTMVAIVKKNNVALLNFFQTPADAASGLRVPIPSINRPHHDFGKPRAAGCRIKLGSAKTKRGPHASCTHSGCLENRVLTSIQLVDDALPAKQQQTRVGIGMISNAMFPGHDL